MHLRHLASLLALPFLAACAPELHATVTTSDIEHVAAAGESIEATALLRLPQPGLAECEANLATLVARLETLAPVATEPRCVAQGFDTFAELRTPLPIVDFEARPADRLAAIVALPTNSGATDLAFRLLQRYDDIFYALAADVSPRPRLDPAAIVIGLRNDGSTPLELLSGGEVLVDGKAVRRETTLPVGATAQLRLTAIAATLVESGIDYTFASFSTP